MASKYVILRNSSEEATWNAHTPEQKADPAQFSAGDVGHMFRVVMGGYKPSMLKRGTIEEGASGNLNVTPGFVFKNYEYVFTLKEDYYAEEEPSGVHLGTQADLEAYFLLNAPSATPSNVIYVVDHYAADTVLKVGVACVMVGDLFPQPVTTTLVGTDAHYMYSVLFRKIAGS